MNLKLPDITPAMPEISLAIFALLLLVVDLFIKRKETIALLSIISISLVILMLTSSQEITFWGMFVSDSYSTFFKLVFLLNAIFTVLLSVRYIVIENINLGEYYSLILFSTLGMMIMASSADLIVLYLGLELMALSTYVLAGFMRGDIRSNEAALKYFLLGAFSSAFLLYGISLIYGLTGTTNLKEIAETLKTLNLLRSPILLLGLIFFIVAFGFKIALVPFHMWAPDAYEGAPTSITAFMSVGPKAAGFAVIGRVFFESLGDMYIHWSSILMYLSILTMAVGNIVAIAQTNIKRMLAYSSIAHAGYAVLGIIAGSQEGLSSMMSYMLIYAFMNIGAFAVVILLRSEGVKGEELSDYEGLAKSHPIASALMLLFMFSLTGIPPTAGFIAKFYVFMSAIHAGYTPLVIIAVIFSVISAFFYLRVVMYMYMKEPRAEVKLSTSPAINIALVITAVATLIVGIFPSLFVGLARAAVAGF